MDKTESSVTITASVNEGVVEMSLEFDLCDAINQDQMMFLAADALLAVEEQLAAKENAGEE